MMTIQDKLCFHFFTQLESWLGPVLVKPCKPPHSHIFPRFAATRWPFYGAITFGDANFRPGPGSLDSGHGSSGMLPKQRGDEKSQNHVTVQLSSKDISDFWKCWEVFASSQKRLKDSTRQSSRAELENRPLAHAPTATAAPQFPQNLLPTGSP